MSTEKQNVLKKLILTGNKRERADLLDALIDVIRIGGIDNLGTVVKDSMDCVDDLRKALIESEERLFQANTREKDLRHQYDVLLTSRRLEGHDLEFLLLHLNIKRIEYIPTIKLVRAVAGLGLKEAKELVDKNVKITADQEGA